jgi:hypothetical protein
MNGWGQGWNHGNIPSSFPRFAQWLRVHDNGATTWAQIEPTKVDATKGISYKWAGLDAQVNAAQSHGIPCMYVVSSTPAWTAIPVSGGPPGIQGPTANCPPAPSDWADFVTAFATRYKGRVKWFEVRNETNSGLWWRGTNAQLLGLSQQAYSIIKSIDPAMQVTTPTPCWGDTDVPTALETYLSMGFQQFADVVTFHGYLPDGAAGGDVAPLLDRILAVLAKHSCKLPVIDSEFGFKKLASPEFVTSSIVERMKRGIGWCWYQWDNQTNGKLYDVATGTLTAAGLAMQTAYNTSLAPLPAVANLVQV